MKRHVLVGLLSVMGVVGVVGGWTMIARAQGCCGGNETAAATQTGAATDTAAAKTAPEQVVNTKCPIMGGAVDPAKVPASLTREFKGQKVGFCCAMCPGQWDKLSDADKEAKPKAVVRS
jgi:hypothetical protein